MNIYYTSLAELVGALLFLVAFKVVMLYAMEIFGRSVSEEPDRPHVKPVPQQLPVSYRLTKHVLASYLLICGLIQVAPAMLSVSAAAESARLTGAVGGHMSAPTIWFLHIWNANKMWTNIWSVVVQLTAAITFWSFRHILSTRITAAIVALGSLFLWIVAENFGYTTGPFASTLGGAPGAALLVAALSGSLVLSWKLWTTKVWLRVLRYANAVYWLYAAVGLALPEHAYWAGRGYAQVAFAQPAPLSPLLHSVSNWAVHIAMTHGFVLTLVLVVIDLLITAAFLASAYSMRALSLAVVVSVAVLTISWIVLASAGLQGAIVFPLGPWPLLIWLSGVTVIVGRVVHASPLPRR